MAQSISVNGFPGNIQPTITVGEIASLISFSYVSSFLSASIDYLYGGKPFGMVDANNQLIYESSILHFVTPQTMVICR